MKRILCATLVLVNLLLTPLVPPSEATTLSRLTTWTSGQVLTHSALNSEFDNLVNDYNGSISAANLAADSVASSELLEGDDYTMNNLILSTTNPDIRWNPTSGDSFHAGAEYSATSGSIWFLSNVTDAKHYLVIRNDHLFELPQYLSCAGGLSTTSTGKVICNPTDTNTDLSTRVFNSASISIGNATATALTFDTETYDTNSFHSTVSNTGRLTVNTTGTYFIFGTVEFAANATGVRQVSIRLNGSTTLSQNDQSTVSNNNVVIVVHTDYQLTAGDYVELLVYQTSGGSLTVETSSPTYPVFGMLRHP